MTFLAETGWPEAATAIAVVGGLAVVISVALWQIFATGRGAIANEGAKEYKQLAEELAQALRPWEEHPERVATLAILPERAGAARARAVPAPADAPDVRSDPRLAALVEQRDVVHVPFRLDWELAEELVGFGDAVVVLDPPGVRRAVLRLLRTAATLDATAGGGSDG